MLCLCHHSKCLVAKCKIAIVSILAMNPDVIVLDEPTAGLDPKSRQQVMELFKENN